MFNSCARSVEVRHGQTIPEPRREPPRLHPPAAHFLRRLRGAGRARQCVAARDGRVRDHRRAHGRLSRPHRQRRRDRRPSQGGRPAHHHVLRLRRTAQHPAPLRPRRSVAPRLPGLSRIARERLRRRRAGRARARSSAFMSIWCRPPAATERRCSSIAASALRSTIGRAPRAKRASKPTGGRRTLVSIDGLPTGLFDEV